MNALELLEKDHQRVTSLFDRLQQADSLGDKRKLFEIIQQELEMHSYVEETILYPVFSRREGFREMIEEAFDEHQEIKDLLEEMEMTFSQAHDTEDEIDLIDDKFDELMDTFEHHVDEEENELFPKIKEVTDGKQLEQIGVQLEAAKDDHSAVA